MGFCGGMSRVIVGIINTVFLLFGLAVLIAGILFKTRWDVIKDAFEKESDLTLKENGSTLGIAAIVFGAFMLIIALLGLIGACCNVKWALGAYGALTLILLIAQIVAVALVATNLGKVTDELKKGLKENQEGFNEDTLLTDARSKAWSSIFQDWECCGVEGPTKSGEFENFNKSSHRLPKQVANYPVSCCKKSFDYEETKIDVNTFNNEDITKCLRKDPEEGFYYTDGCEQKAEDYIKDHKSIIIGVGCAVFAVELLIVIMAFWLCSRHDEYEEK